MAKYSLAQIKEAYIQKKDWEKQFPVSYFLFRPVSFYLTYAVLYLTESPSLVAWFGFAIGLAGCFSFLLLPRLGIWPGIWLVTLFSLLDAVDGNIARVTKTVSYYGKYLDGVIGLVIESSYCFWLGLGLHCFEPAYPQNPVMVAGVMIMAGRLYGNIVEAYYDNYCIQKEKDAGNFTETLNCNIGSSIYRKYWWYLVFANLNTLNVQLAVLIMCAALRRVDLFLFCFAAYYIFRFLVTMVFYLARARTRLN